MRKAPAPTAIQGAGEQLSFLPPPPFCPSCRCGSGGLDPEACLDLVALATVDDIVPLQDENRILVREGLMQINRGARCGIRALKQVAGITKACTSETIGFRLGPRLNAAGRLDHAMRCVQLLTTESDREAMQIAEQLEQLNRQRKQIEEGITAEAGAQLQQDEPAAAIVLGSRDCHLGVVGIVAARLVDRFHRPSIVSAVDDKGIGRGLAERSTGLISTRDCPSAEICWTRLADIRVRRD